MDSGIQIEGLEKMTEDMCDDEGNKKQSKQIAEERGVTIKNGHFSSWVSMEHFV